MSLPTTTTDVVLVDTIQLTANIGPDCWGRLREQPVSITVHLHLKPSFLNISAHSDNVVDSIHYGHLTKAISALSPSYADVRALVHEVTQKAFVLAGVNVDAVRVVIGLPKQILLANDFEVEVITPRGKDDLQQAARVSVKDLIIPVLIGVNPPERLAKQRVITNITFYEKSGMRQVDYPAIIKQISNEIENTAYLTLEKFVLHIVRSSCLASDAIEAVTTRSQKPSALSFAHSSGVEMTRYRDAFQ
ncbi:Dihydroneopterin aldolase-domain-containing protein [Suillus subalutaceus]|uniref:Dihydroneopterin aldolase-domain-containing protein n=1 Tax=Suillus subalutaceus TaxID=48586 RepID=UPI001B87D021|nr:Dihydroneopterin aldolase-domain-containing protein [Suillus subalutaceus]KAG1850214.1 Dihydroneopterin aldolase-domain-containing protein [Suillus subalutaceus]